MEYCFTQDGTLGGDNMLVACRPGTQGAWGHSLSYTLGALNSDTAATVYGEYRLVVGSDGNYTAYPSYPNSASIYEYVASTLPSVNEPAGLPNPNYTTSNGLQPQYLNYGVEQWLSWSDLAGGAVTLLACSTGCQTLPFGGTTLISPWLPSSYMTGGGFIDISPLTAPFPPPTITPLPAPSSTPVVTCSPAPAPSGDAPCKILADATNPAGDMPGDPPSGPVVYGGVTELFSGYADPCMRADALMDPVANPAGDNLWMTYSWPTINTVDPTGTPTPSLATHIASSHSTSSGGYPAGWQWTSYCNPSATCPPATPIFPSPTTSSTSGTTASLFHGPAWVLGSPGPGQPIQYYQVNRNYYSSHEVSNLAQYVDTSTNTSYWYAVHLMYFVPVGLTVQNSLVNGCLVISAATGPPTNLQWPNYTDENPTDCNPADGWGPTNGSYPMQFGNPSYPPGYPSGSPNLNTLAGLTGANACQTWGEPAIMVAPAPPGSPYSGQTWLYLAALCIQVPQGTTTYEDKAYYVFYNPISTTNWNAPASGWQPYAPGGSIMTFSYSNLNSILPAGLSFPTGTFLTEFDWAVDADGSTIVAVGTPETVLTGQPPMQNGCVAVGFDLYATTTNPFTSFIAYVTDSQPGTLGQIYEQNGPNGCTYEPKSNTGIPIVRHLVNTADLPPQQYQTYSIVDTGVIP